MTAVELVLTYDEGRWHARGADVDLAHVELASLDRLIAAALARTAERVDVRFDLTSLPAWLRQYQAHYCNYRLTLAATDGALP